VSLRSTFPGLGVAFRSFSSHANLPRGENETAEMGKAVKVVAGITWLGRSRGMATTVTASCRWFEMACGILSW
jgi:hypothetical protein